MTTTWGLFILEKSSWLQPAQLSATAGTIFFYLHGKSCPSLQG